ncbi:hypothetical protein IMZ38_00595 [Thermosphaera chiliense]|uniref:ABC transmembrane type-1 domain-containing protein n=1 Tax=Thermosphaera chiliense TaxID=3402707 RepID=A0A7M1USH6_9CREN|nr:hypothetical protein [Thermosphaera aggregans]QOR94487.1 hypothetical protein IMZ38_00595 [Thermosphaera aggregans]
MQPFSSSQYKSLKPVKALVSFTILILVWELVARARVYPSYILPSFSEVAGCFLDGDYMRIVLENAVLTVIRAGAGFAVGVVVGIALGLLVVGLKIDEYVQPIASILFTLPTVVWVPLLLL